MANVAPDRRQALYEEYRRTPPNRHAEIIRGTLYVLPRPSPPHANASSVLGSELNGPFQRGKHGPGGWWILDEPELQLLDLEPVIPDIAGWRVERMPQLPETAHFALVPDWVCEVLSPPTERIDRGEKLPFYAEQGVRHVWLVDPIARSLEVYALAGIGKWGEVRMHRDEDRVRAGPFDAIELDLPALGAAPVSSEA